MTDTARTLVRDLTDQAEVAGTGGVRIAPAAAAGHLELAIAAEPEPGDAVVEAEDGARLFLEPEIATLLSDATLDAQGGDQPGFVLTQQEGDAAQDA